MVIDRWDIWAQTTAAAPEFFSMSALLVNGPGGESLGLGSVSAGSIDKCGGFAYWIAQHHEDDEGLDRELYRWKPGMSEIEIVATNEPGGGIGPITCNDGLPTFSSGHLGEHSLTYKYYRLIERNN